MPQIRSLRRAAIRKIDLMRIRIKVRRRPEPEPTFPAALPQTRRPWLPMLSSVAAHAAVLTILPIVADQVSQYYADDFSWAAYRAQAVTLRLPETLYYTPPKTAGSNTKRQPRPQKSVTQEPLGGRGANLAKAAPIPRGLQLPATSASGRGTSALLQPDPLPKVEFRPTKLPPLAFWARTDGQAPKPRQDEITPGTAEQAATAPHLAAPPVRAVPNRELNLGEQNIASSAPVHSASLPVAPSATAPIRDQSSDPRNGALDRSAGQSANVISLSAEPPIQPGQVVVVPPGSHGGGLHGNDQAAGAGSGDASQGSSTVAKASAAAAPGEPRRSASAGSLHGSGTEPKASGAQPKASGPEAKVPGAVSQGAPQNAAAVAMRASSPAPLQAPAQPNRGAEAFTRIMHPPNGTFDVVVTQSGGAAEVPGAATHLTGNPVYSVYLRVGDSREWVLAFCSPSKMPRNNRYEVYVEDAAPLDPPYPIKTTIPKSMASQHRSTPLVFHGFLTAAGAFRNMQPDAQDAITSQIAAALAEWQFRPARKNNVPTEIQVALIIPATDDAHGQPPADRGF